MATGALRHATMIQNFGEDGLTHFVLWFETNKYGLNSINRMV